MSVWDDSWGACDARGVRGDRGMLGGTNEDAGPRCVNTMWGPASHLDWRWLEMTPAYPGHQGQRPAPTVTDLSPTEVTP